MSTTEVESFSWVWFTLKTNKTPLKHEKLYKFVDLFTFHSWHQLAASVMIHHSTQSLCLFVLVSMSMDAVDEFWHFNTLSFHCVFFAYSTETQFVCLQSIYKVEKRRTTHKFKEKSKIHSINPIVLNLLNPFQKKFVFKSLKFTAPFFKTVHDGYATTIIQLIIWQSVFEKW